MSEPEKPKRRFWQIHLSTALILVFIASIFVALNFSIRLAKTRNERHAGFDSGFGWPELACYADQTWNLQGLPELVYHADETWNLRGLAIDILAFSVSIATAAIICETIMFSSKLSFLRNFMWPPHAATVIMAVSLLGFLFWINIKPRISDVRCYPKLHACWSATIDGPGWPIPIKVEGYAESNQELIERDYYRDLNWSHLLYERASQHANQWSVAVDAAFAGMMLFLVCAPMQFLVRRREGRKT